MCAIRWVNEKKTVLSAFDSMVVGARRTGLCQELQRCWDFHGQQFPVCIKNGPPPKGHPANFIQLVICDDAGETKQVRGVKHLIKTDMERDRNSVSKLILKTKTIQQRRTELGTDRYRGGNEQGIIDSR